ncbi:MAG: Nramp family divalent metal transporter [Planctomycetota bacterium]|nr:Nramp family divalent metal transporter [Planctomycetota bacterium]
MNRSPWYGRIGPGLITACVVIGPGSIVTSSSVGAKYGYSMLWIVLVAVIFQLAFMTIASRLGSIQSSSICDMLREKGKSNWAIAVGICVFFIAAAFQSGNNMGIAAVFEELFPPENSETSGPNYLIPALVVIFNSCAIIFLFAFRNLYQLVERMMMFLVALMLLSFTINLVTLRPNLGEVARGFVPRMDLVDISVLGLIGTTFVITAAFYQAYLVRQKGWSLDDVKAGSTDARIGAGIMGTITIMLMATAAAGLHTGSGDAVTLTNPIQIATALEPTFGSTGRWIFCLGLFSAAYSSFLVNSMIGGFVLSDGLGLGCEATDRWPRVFTSFSLLTGMAVAIAAIQFNFDRAPTIIAAQAVTVVGSPLVAIVLVWLASDKKWLGRPLKWFSYLGIALLVSMALRTAFVTLPAKLESYSNAAIKPAPVVKNADSNE